MAQSKLFLKEIDRNKDDEVQLFCDIITKSFTKTPYPVTPDKVKSSQSVYFFALTKEKNEIVGTSGLSPKSPHLVETTKTVVKVEFQGSGYGKIISQLIEDECVRRGYKKIMTGIYDFNLGMLQIKLKQGYTVEGYHRDHDAPGYHEYTLGKLIV